MKGRGDVRQAQHRPALSSSKVHPQLHPPPSLRRGFGRQASKGRGLLGNFKGFWLVFLLVFSYATIVPAEELLVAAAADLVYAFQKMDKPFGDAHGVKIKWIFGSSGMLSTQIQGGLGSISCVRKPGMGRSAAGERIGHREE